MENMSVNQSTKDNVDKLQDLINRATEFNVEAKYLETANGLGGKMNDSIVARETLQMLQDYPIREYPPPEPLDKNGKPIK